MNIIEQIYVETRIRQIHNKKTDVLYLGYNQYHELMNEIKNDTRIYCNSINQNDTFNGMIVKIYKRENYLGIR